MAQVAQPLYKQAMPVAFSPSQFKSLSPEQKAVEKKKCGCCCCCCLWCIVIIVAIVLASGTALAACANPKVCPYETLKPGSEIISTVGRDFVSSSTSIDVEVMRGSIDVSQSTVADSSATVVNKAYEDVLEKNDFVEDNGVWTSVYDTSGTGTNDCYYCRTSEVSLVVGTGAQDISVDCMYCHVTTSSAITTTGEAVFLSTSGDITVSNAVTAANLIQIATSAGKATATGALTADTVDFMGGIGVTGELEHNVGVVTATSNATITSYSKGKTVLKGLVTATTGDIFINSKVGSKVEVPATSTLTAGTAAYFTGNGFITVDSQVVAPTIDVSVSTSGIYKFNNLKTSDFTTLNIVQYPTSDAEVSITCDAGTYVDITVTYVEKSGKKSFSSMNYIDSAGTELTVAEFTQTNETTTIAGVAATRYFANHRGCGGTGDIKTVLVDLELATGGTFKITEVPI